jgi:hypothetical protein
MNANFELKRPKLKLIEWIRDNKFCKYCNSNLTSNKSCKTCDNCGADYPRMPRQLYYGLLSQAACCTVGISGYAVFHGMKIVPELETV